MTQKISDPKLSSWNFLINRKDTNKRLIYKYLRAVGARSELLFFSYTKTWDSEG